MTGTDSTHFQVVMESLTGQRAVDEQSFSSLAILDERLQKVKKYFGDVSFSPAVEELAGRRVVAGVN